MDAYTEIEIRDGTRLAIRPIEPGDKAAIAEGFDRLSPESRYRRFFAPLDHLTQSDLRYLTEVDHENHEALIAFDPEGDRPVGVARFVRSSDPSVAEVAVTVIDDWQGRGVATALLEQLVQRAREVGIERFLALILADNDAAIELFRQLSTGDPEPRMVEAGNAELLIDLPAGEEISGTLLGRALRSAASSDLVMNPWRRLKARLKETAEHPLVDPAPGHERTEER